LIRLLELYPDHLNLNGDRGNLRVLEQRLTWASLDVQSFTHRPGQPLSATAPQFVLLGHGSAAAWRVIYSDLNRIAPTLQQWLEGGTQLLAVSTGFAALHGLLPQLDSSVERVARVSKFEEAESQGIQVVGYKNSDLDLPSLFIDGNLFGTLLHGPILAKNESLADFVISKILESENLQVEIARTKRDSVSEFAHSASQLARELASE
jgi:CobQ-like glutamine amidotransferase family enzyme